MGPQSGDIVEAPVGRPPAGAERVRWIQVADATAFVTQARALGLDTRGAWWLTEHGPAGRHPLAHVRRIGDDWLLAWLPTVWFRETGAEVHTGELACLVGRSVVVTFEAGGAKVHEDALDRLRSTGGSDGTGLHRTTVAILLAVVSAASRVEVELGDAVAELEKTVFGPEESDPVQRIYALKREITEARRALLPVSAELPELVDPERSAGLAVDPRMVDRMISTVERIDRHLDAHDDLLSDMLSVHLSQISVRQNEDMRKISAWAAILVYPTIVAGVYGMNFTHMPELRWQLGYPFAIVLMITGCLVLYRWFKKAGWL